MHSASAHRMNAMGGAKLDFKLTGCAKNFNHEWQLIEGATSPTILRVSFWAKYASQFDFKDRVIKMIVDGEKVQVPFTIGDEKRKETEMGAEENVALYALEDTVVPPRSGYLVPTRPEHGTHGQYLHAQRKRWRSCTRGQTRSGAGMTGWSRGRKGRQS